MLEQHHQVGMNLGGGEIAEVRGVGAKRLVVRELLVEPITEGFGHEGRPQLKEIDQRLVLACGSHIGASGRARSAPCDDSEDLRSIQSIREFRASLPPGRR